MTLESAKIGRLGERRAAGYLRRRGYRILSRNFRTRYGEVDIVAHEGDALCFVEVKTRTSLEFGGGEEFIDAHKMRQIAGVAESYVRKFGLDEMQRRFDCVYVLVKPGERPALLEKLFGPRAEIRLVRDAFTYDDIRRG